METTDWTPQSIITLIAGVLATIDLITFTAYAFTRGVSEVEAGAASPLPT